MLEKCNATNCLYKNDHLICRIGNGIWVTCLYRNKNIKVIYRKSKTKHINS